MNGYRSVRRRSFFSNQQPAQPSLESVGVSDLTITLRKNSTTFTLDVATLDSILRTSHATTLTLTSPPKRDPADQLTSQIDFIGPDLKTLHLHLPNPSLRTLQVPNPLSYTEVESILALPSMEGLKNIERE